MRLYVDTSALVKRVEPEAFSAEVTTRLEEANTVGDELTASSLVWVEVERAIRFKYSGTDLDASELSGAARLALSGVAELAITDQVLRAARWIGSDTLRTLDAIHLATALLDGADLMITYDKRLAQAALAVGIAVESPGADL
jgi:predicted nucleic acid-binding protein